MSDFSPVSIHEKIWLDSKVKRTRLCWLMFHGWKTGKQSKDCFQMPRCEKRKNTWVYFIAVLARLFPLTLISWCASFKSSLKSPRLCTNWYSASKPYWVFTGPSYHLSWVSRFSILFWKLLSLGLYPEGNTSTSSFMIELIWLFHNPLN